MIFGRYRRDVTICGMNRFATECGVGAAVVFAISFVSACSDCENSSDCPSGRICADGECESAKDDADGGCGDTFVGSESALDFGDVSPSSGPVSIPLIYENKGSSSVYVIDYDVATKDNSCGDFSIAGDKGAKEVSPGGKLETAIVFTPNADADPGCPCYAVGFFGLHLQGLEACEVEDVPLIAAGRCDEPLRCNESEVSFPDSVIGSGYEKVVSCYSLAPGETVVEKVAMTASSSPSFSIVGLESNFPLKLSTGQSVSFAVRYAPVDPGDDSGDVEIALSGGAKMAIELSGTADRERPLCDSGVPVLPDPVLEADDYVIALESENLSFYPGAVRSQWFYDDQPPLISDILVTSGSFLDTDDCQVSQNGHRYEWTNCDPSGGTINNIHAVPGSENAEKWVMSLETWDLITVVGYEVARIDYDNGSWWTDAGCNTLIVTWICDGELNGQR